MEMEIVLGILGLFFIICTYSFVVPSFKCSEEKKAIIQTILITLLVPCIWLMINGATYYGEIAPWTVNYIEKNLTREQRKEYKYLEQRKEYKYLMKNLPMQDREEFSRQLYFKIRRERDQKIRDLINDF